MSCFSELKTAFESQLHSKEAEFECQRAEWETRLNQAIDDNASRIATLQVDHESRLSQDRERYETTIEKLEREKREILEGEDTVFYCYLQTYIQLLLFK